MTRTFLGLVLALLFTSSVNAKEQESGDTGTAVPPHAQADLVFVVPFGSVRYSPQAHMLVCFNKTKNMMIECRNDGTDATLTLDELWKVYFPAAKGIRVVSMGFGRGRYSSWFIFWLKR